MKNLLLGFLGTMLSLFVACSDNSGSKNDGDNVVPDTSTVSDETVGDAVVTDDVVEQETSDDAPVVADEESDESSDDLSDEEPLDDTDMVADPLVSHLVGFWAMKLELFADATVPVVGDIVTRTDKIIRLELLQKDGKVYADWLHAEVCHMETFVTEGNEIAKTITTYFPPKFTANFFYIPPENLKKPKDQISISGTPDQFTFVMNKWYEMRGAYFQGENGTQPFDIETEMISDKNDPRIFDHDEDGRPGHTFEIKSTIANGLIWGVIKNHMEFVSTSAAGNRIEGAVNWGEEEVVIGTNNPLFDGPREVLARQEGNTLRMVKIEPMVTCEDILDQQDILFQP